jgi:hypothetical protein
MSDTVEFHPNDDAAKWRPANATVRHHPDGTSTITAWTKSITNHDWLEAVDQHPETTTADLLTAYHLVGAATDQTPEQIDKGTFRLHLLGFLRPGTEGDTYSYEFRVPELAR